MTETTTPESKAAKPQRALTRKTAKLIELSAAHDRLVERLDALEASLGEQVVPTAHIVSPARNMVDAKNGKPTASMCGVVVSKSPQDGAAVCRKCFDLNRARMETEAAEWMAKEREKGKTEGVLSGRADSMREIREAAERRATELAAAS